MMIPMLMAIISIIVALGITALVGQVFPLNLFIANMVVAMGLALGIDYSLFIVSRLREERRHGRDTREAIMTVANTATNWVAIEQSDQLQTGASSNSETNTATTGTSGVAHLLALKGKPATTIGSMSRNVTSPTAAPALFTDTITVGSTETFSANDRLEFDVVTPNDSTNCGTAISTVCTITAATGEDADGRKEISSIIVPTDTPGFEVGRSYRKLGWHASDTHELAFNDLRVPEENLLGEPGRGFAQFLQVGAEPGQPEMLGGDQLQQFDIEVQPRADPFARRCLAALKDGEDQHRKHDQEQQR